MKKGDQPAYPNHPNPAADRGLSKREYFAGLAMQARAGGEYTGQSGMPHCDIAQWSVAMADALLAELAKPTA